MHQRQRRLVKSPEPASEKVLRCWISSERRRCRFLDGRHSQAVSIACKAGDSANVESLVFVLFHFSF